MKKYLLTMLLVLVGCMTAMAGSNFELLNGNTALLRIKGAKATIVFDWENASWDNREPLRSHFEHEMEYNNLVENFEDMFVAQFNKSSKGLCLTKEEAVYTMVVSIKAFDHAWQGISGMEASFWGTIVVTDQNGKEIFKIKVTDLEGGTTIKGVDEAYKRLTEKLAKKIANFKE